MDEEEENGEGGEKDWQRVAGGGVQMDLGKRGK